MPGHSLISVDSWFRIRVIGSTEALASTILLSGEVFVPHCEKINYQCKSRRDMAFPLTAEATKSGKSDMFWA
jgi:hypothetical protein